MIHPVLVSSGETPQQIKKLFRKKLMTGGAVIRIPETADSAELRKLLELYSVEVGDSGIARDVLVELASHPALTDELARSLDSLEIPGVARVLEARFLRESSDGRGQQQRVAHQAHILREESAPSLRKFFLRSLGDAEHAVVGRLALCCVGSLPTDLAFLLERDPVRQVRFHARYQAEISDLRKIKGETPHDA